MIEIEECIQPACVLVICLLMVICYSLFEMSPFLTGGVISGMVRLVEMLVGRAVGIKEFKGLISTLKIIKKKEKPSEFYSWTKPLRGGKKPQFIV